jgi:putative membrane protein
MMLAASHVEEDGSSAAPSISNRTPITDRRSAPRSSSGTVFNRDGPRSFVISTSLIVAGFFGFLLVVFLIIESGAAEVASAMLVLGWWLAPITLYHLVPLSLDALSWRELLPASSRPGFLGVLRIRWIRESINTLLPVAGVGGDVAGARLAHKSGVPGAQAAASMVVDITVGAGTQTIFVLAGVTLLATRSDAEAAAAVAQVTLIGVAVFAGAIAAFVLVQHNSMFALFVRLLRRVAPEKWLSVFADHASAIDDAVTDTYRRLFAFFRANVLRLAGWAAGAGETWLVMYLLGRPLSVTDAFILEGLSSGVRAAAFMVPGALGALEGSIVVFGALFGLPADMALAVSLSKRVRELVLGLPGLVAWQWVEGHHLLRRHEDQAGPASQ